MFRAWLEAMPPLTDIGLDENGEPRLYDKSRLRPTGSGTPTPSAMLTAARRSMCCVS